MTLIARLLSTSFKSKSLLTLCNRVVFFLLSLKKCWIVLKTLYTDHLTTGGMGFHISSSNNNKWFGKRIVCWHIISGCLHEWNQYLHFFFSVLKIAGFLKIYRSSNHIMLFEKYLMQSKISKDDIRHKFNGNHLFFKLLNNYLSERDGFSR